MLSGWFGKDRLLLMCLPWVWECRGSLALPNPSAGLSHLPPSVSSSPLGSSAFVCLGPLPSSLPLGLWGFLVNQS